MVSDLLLRRQEALSCFIDAGADMNKNEETVSKFFKSECPIA